MSEILEDVEIIPNRKVRRDRAKLIRRFLRRQDRSEIRRQKNDLLKSNNRQPDHNPL